MSQLRLMALVLGVFVLLACSQSGDDKDKKNKNKPNKPAYTDFIPTKKPAIKLERPDSKSDISNGYGAWETKVDGKDVKAGASAIKQLPKQFRINPSQKHSRTNQELEKIDIQSTGMKTWEGKMKAREDINHERPAQDASHHPGT